MSGENDLTMKVMELQKEVSQLVTVNAKLDAMLDRLTIVSSDISKLLAVQSIRLENQEKVGVALSQMIDKRKEEVDRDINNINNKFDVFDKEIEAKFDKMISKIDKQHEYVKSKISKIEKWIYVVTGGGLVVGFLISQLIKFI